MPEVARDEVAEGLFGRIRAAFAAHADRRALGSVQRPIRDDPMLLDLRDQLVMELVGGVDRLAGVTLAAHVHLARGVRGTVPLALAVQCLGWYLSYVQPGSTPAELFAEANELGEGWRTEAHSRAQIEAEMAAFARQVVGDNPLDLLDLPI
ncbi:hypothetical protein [uncultured Jatrophihabitans sp.]|uniref:hypothetical protein n=1 Tax=uncultured Jatrophihabitans sp. TaxID=1610747 RepID=UPI0035CCA14B